MSRTEVDGAGWKAWRDEARKAMERQVGQYHPGDDVALQEELYKKAMPFLLELFHGKCAYCETVISSNQPGDVEHYRPKGRIRDDDGKILRARIGNREVEHPGYWWLAYEWTNLLPACIDCNRRRRHGEQGQQAGKADYFSVRGRRAVLPADPLPPENPLLLDPSAPGFDVGRHFELHDDGTMKPLTDEARYSEKVLGLNLRETLVAQRAEAYLQAQQALVFLLGNAATAPAAVLARTRRQINDMWEGRSAYSAFARRGLDAVCGRLEQSLGVRIRLPLPA